MVQVGAASLRPDNLKDPYLEKIKTDGAADPSYQEILEAIRTSFLEKNKKHMVS